MRACVGKRERADACACAKVFCQGRGLPTAAQFGASCFNIHEILSILFPGPFDHFFHGRVMSSSGCTVAIAGCVFEIMLQHCGPAPFSSVMSSSECAGGVAEEYRKENYFGQRGVNRNPG